MKSKSFRFGNHTDIGKVRQQNEDYMGFFENSNGSFFVVCDGMGGHVGGAIASQTAVHTIRTFFETQYYTDPAEAIYQAIQYANQQIYYKAQMDNGLFGMGTTCVLLMFRKGQIYHAHVGDSRIYQYTEGIFKRLTKDHSYVQALIDQGVITEEEAESHPRRNEILRALGIQSFVDVEVCQVPITPLRGDKFLLCTDGLTGLVSDEGIADVLKSVDMDVQHKSIRLVDLANTLGGHDNITVQIVEFLEDGKNLMQAATEEDTAESFMFGMNPPNSGTSDLKKKLKSSEYIEPISESKFSKSNRNFEDEMIEIRNTGIDFNYRPYLINGFMILAVLVGLYLFYQNTIGNVSFLGSSGSVKKDSLRAVEIEMRFWEMLGYQKVKTSYEKTLNTYRKLKDYKERLDKFFDNKKVINSLKKKKESLDEFAKKHKSKISWILEANGVKSEGELQTLDSLIVPLEEPTLPEDELEK
jgi:serine/threonine protein phosphatase PrpC